MVLKTSMQVVLSGSVGDHRRFISGCKNSDHGEGAVEIKKSNPEERREKEKEGECTCRWEGRHDPCSAPV